MDSPPTPAPIAPAPVPAPPRTDYQVEFTATGAEYFRVWFVNVALTIVTLGIYSAWAKVRNKQYFYGNSRLAGGSFAYTANPINILKGRLLVFGVFVAYQLAVTFQPVAALILALFIIPLLPWIIIKSVGFNLRYSSYRGLRFHFDGTYWEAFRIYLLLTLAVVASFGLAYPYVAWRRRQFLVDRSRYGRSPFAFSGEVGFFYVVYIIAGIAYMGAAFGGSLLVAAAAAIGAVISGVGTEDMGGVEKVDKETIQILVIAGGAIVYVAFFVLFIAIATGIQAMIANHSWQRTRIGAVTFDLKLNLWRMVWIQMSNVVAIILSIGLLIPWAKVRKTRYWLSCFTVSAVSEELERFVAAERERVEATGAELGDALDLDLGI